MPSKSYLRGKVAFVGGVDTQKLLSKTSPAEIKDEIRRLVDLLSPALVVGPNHEAVPPSVPPENLVAMSEAVFESGSWTGGTSLLADNRAQWRQPNGSTQQLTNAEVPEDGEKSRTTPLQTSVRDAFDLRDVPGFELLEPDTLAVVLPFCGHGLDPPGMLLGQVVCLARVSGQRSQDTRSESLLPLLGEAGRKGSIL